MSPDKERDTGGNACKHGNERWKGIDAMDVHNVGTTDHRPYPAHKSQRERIRVGNRPKHCQANVVIWCDDGVFWRAALISGNNLYCDTPAGDRTAHGWQHCARAAPFWSKAG